MPNHLIIPDLGEDHARVVLGGLAIPDWAVWVCLVSGVHLADRRILDHRVQVRVSPGVVGTGVRILGHYCWDGRLEDCRCGRS